MHEKPGRNCSEVYIYGLIDSLWGSIAGENNLIFSSLYDRIVGAWIEWKTHIKDPKLNNMPHFKITRPYKNITSEYIFETALKKKNYPNKIEIIVVGIVTLFLFKIITKRLTSKFLKIILYCLKQQE